MIIITVIYLYFKLSKEYLKTCKKRTKTALKPGNSRSNIRKKENKKNSPFA